MYPNCYSAAAPVNLFGQPTFPTAYNMQSVQSPLYPQGRIEGLRGRIVDRVEDITINEVPMDTSSLFPLRDGSAIFIKSWNADGTIKTLKYELVPDDYINKEGTRSNDRFEEFRKEITERFDKLERLYSSVNRKPVKPVMREGEKDA